MILCVSTFPETAHFAKTLWLVGCALASIVYGILLILAYSCAQALRRRKSGSPNVNRGLIIYVLLTAMITTAAEVLVIQRTLLAVLDETCVGPYLHVFSPYFGPFNVVSFSITLLTDGLLVSTTSFAKEVVDTHNFRFGDATLLPRVSGGLVYYG